MSDRSLGLAPAILSVAGPVLTPDERALFKAAQPFGFILFARNCIDRAQLKRLCADLRDAVGWACPIFIDQEGGRVLRLKEPVWKPFPPQSHFGQKAEKDSAAAQSAYADTIHHMVSDLKEVGIDGNCVPALDYLCADTHPFLADRLYSADPRVTEILSDQLCTALLREGIWPVIKHLPGHGRAQADSHETLPVVETPRAVLEETDFALFRCQAAKPYGWKLFGMTAHVVYSSMDPDLPATLSPAVIRDVIRRSIGFEGLLMADDLSMGALSKFGPLEARARLALEAGCDLALYCAGHLKDMDKLMETLPSLAPATHRRIESLFLKTAA